MSAPACARSRCARTCEREYRDPSDRRFHAEPIACPACGPTIRLLDASGRARRADPIEGAAELIAAGKIVALKGLGGFHLACDATNERAVAELRERKRRPAKPFAVMVADLDHASERFDLNDREGSFLASSRAPIVLVRDRGTLARSVAPGHRRQGAMLPSTPLHHLLVRAAQRPLVMTSGNRGDEPICITNDEALERLGGIADAFVVHDRQIVARYDDSVTRVWRGEPVVLRRARSSAPAPIELAMPVPPTLGTGAELHGAFCLAEGTKAFLSQHVGDLDTDQTMAAYADALERYRRLFEISPELVAHDLHPDFLTTRFAQEMGLSSVAVQHHHAHVASVMAEHRLEGRLIGVAYDGFGLGEDGTAWGGEFLVGDAGGMERAAHLRAVPLPGGDEAVRRPWRMALAHAVDAGVLEAALPFLGDHGPETEVVLGQIRSGLGSGPTSSMGRLFDAVAALTGVCDRATYEGQPAILLEQVAEHGATREYPFDLTAEPGRHGPGCSPDGGGGRLRPRTRAPVRRDRGAVPPHDRGGDARGVPALAGDDRPGPRVPVRRRVPERPADVGHGRPARDGRLPGVPAARGAGGRRRDRARPGPRGRASEGMRAMCLGVPGKVIEVFEQDGIRMGAVDFGGIRRNACLEYAPEVDIGSYVMIHVGFAISTVDEAEAARSYALLAEMNNLENIDLPQDPEGVPAEHFRGGLAS